MAEALFQKLLARLGRDNEYSCSSAGVYAYEGDPAPAEARQAMQKYGLNLSGHAASILTDEATQQAFRILTMTGKHKQMLLDVYPGATDKTFTLKEFAGYNSNNWDIQDPFGQDTTAYQSCAEELYAALHKIMDKL